MNRLNSGSLLRRLIFGSATFQLIVLTSVISVVVFILSKIYCSSDACVVWNSVALRPSSIMVGEKLWTLFTHMFVHGGILHLLMNMFVLFSLGGLCEKIIGRKRFIWFYLLSGIFAGVLSVLLAGFFGYGIGERFFGSASVSMVGASGAIFAIAGLFMMLLPRLKFSIIFFPFFSLPAYIMVPLVLFLTWGISIAAALPIGNVAHFGGFLAGVLYGWYLRYQYGRKIEQLQRFFR
ncbi:MAG TPA: rhomboid family intramembrane serine protease [Candidatus Nanoarchaeia archaeon]|nr:rhomboid family intramembrane serine protease [Candidatus Nanoarchaeia archaeon]